MREHEQIAAWAGHHARGIRALSSILCVTAIAIAITLAAGTPAVAQRVVRTEMVGGPGAVYPNISAGRGGFWSGCRVTRACWLTMCRPSARGLTTTAFRMRSRKGRSLAAPVPSTIARNALVIPPSDGPV